MRFLKENRELFYAGALFPLLFAVEDRNIIGWMKYFDQSHFPLYRMLRHFDPFINFVGHGSTLIILSCLLFALGMKYGEGIRYTGKSLFFSFLAAGLSVQVLKHLIGRARPRLTENFIVVGPTFKNGYDSFPSGHSAVVFCFACVLSHQFPRFRAVFYGFAVIIGFMRVVDLSHFPSDVAAGAILGMIVGKLLMRNGRWNMRKDCCHG